MEQTQATTCKADLRDISGDGTYVSAITAITPQFTMRDEALAIGKRMVYPVLEDTFFVLIPVSGGVDIVDPSGNAEFAGPHELLSFFCKAGGTFILFNPYQEDHVNVIIATYKGHIFGTETGFHKATFSLELQNTVTALDANGPRIAIGMYEADKEGIFESGNPLFAFIINGSFQLENQILESRDALLIPERSKTGFKSVSGDAIILLAELPA